MVPKPTVTTIIMAVITLHHPTAVLIQAITTCLHPAQLLILQLTITRVPIQHLHIAKRLSDITGIKNRLIRTPQPLTK